GCTFYHLLAGQPPFAGASMVAKIASHVTSEPPAIEEHRAELPWELGEVLRRMMAKRPDERYQTPAEVAQALEPFAASGAPVGIQALPAELNRQVGAETMPGPRSFYNQTMTQAPISPGRRRWAAAAVVLAALACIGAVVWLIALDPLHTHPSGATGTGTG